MYRLSLACGRAALALAALAMAGSPGRAQVSNPNPGTTSGPYYPYWSSAPGNYGGASLPATWVGPAYGSYSSSPIYPGLGPGYLGPGLTGLSAGPYAPSRGSNAPSLGFGSSSIGYYSPAALAEAASLLPGNSQPAPDNAAHVILQVPAGAEVWFDGDKTRQTGTLRHYFSPPLTPGKDYVYEVRVRWTRDGKPVEETRRVHVHANAWVSLDLTRAPEGTKPSAGKTVR
jgi:uncharacterized protein (TIGR03000 family)